jgi:hypothetical protein
VRSFERNALPWKESIICKKNKCDAELKRNVINKIAMKIILFIVLLFIPHSIFADTIVFSKTFGGTQNDYAHSIQQTADGGYIVCGQTDSYGNGSNLYPDMWIIKLDKTGSKEWDKTFGGDKSDIANCVRQTSDMGYIVAGTTSSFGKGYPSIWIIKLNAKGDSLWSRIFEGNIVSSAQSIRQTTDGGYIIAGLGKENILKLDKNGNKEWGKHFSRIFYSVEQTKDGGYIAAGDSIYQQLEWDYIPSLSVIKLDRVGNKEWSNPLGNNFRGRAYSIEQTTDGGYIFSGDSIAIKSEYNHSHYSLATKLDKDGNIKWKYYGRENSIAQSIRQTADEGYIAAGNTIDNDYGLNFLIVLLDIGGKEKWIKSYGNNTQWEYASSIQQTSDGGYVVAGQTESSGAGRYDVWILKLDNNGNQEPTGIFDPGYVDPYGLSLSQNYPNPFSKSTTITFNLPEPGFIVLTVFDIYGKEMETIFKGHLPRGESRVEWTPDNLPDGIYYYRLQLGMYIKTKSMILMR